MPPFLDVFKSALHGLTVRLDGSCNVISLICIVVGDDFTPVTIVIIVSDKGISQSSASSNLKI